MKSLVGEASPTRDFIEPPTRYYDSQIKKPYPLHEKYDLLEVHGCEFSRFDAHIIKATRIDQPDQTINVDLPVYFLYHSAHKRRLIIKVRTSKNYEEAWYDAIGKKIETTPNPYDKIVTWVEFLERVCEDPTGDRSLYRLEPADN